MFRCVITIMIILLGFSSISVAQEPTVDKIRRTRAVTLGVRDSSGALSFTIGNGRYDGFHVEICRQIVSMIQDHLSLSTLTINYIPVSSQNRISLVQNGTIDLECGSTTNNLARQRDVAFANTLFVEEVRMAVRRDSMIKKIADLEGKTVVSTTGSAPVQILRARVRSMNVDFQVLYGKDHADSFLLLETGRADAFVMDASILAGNIANARDPSDFAIVGEPLSFEPIAIMLRKNDPEFKALVDSSISQFIQRGDLPKLWNKWFLQPIPPRGRTMGLALSEATRRAWSNPNDRPAEDYRFFKIETAESDHRRIDWLVFCRNIVTGKIDENCLGPFDHRAEMTYLNWLLIAWRWTLSVAASGFLVAVVVGLPIGALRTIVQSRWLKALLTILVEFFRNVPILLLVFIWYFVIPVWFPLMKQIPPFVIVTVAIGFFTAARLAEQMRAGILALPKGQLLAAKALGLTLIQSYRLVILPVVLRQIIPPLTSEAMNIIKNSAVAFAVSVPELTMFAMQAHEETSRAIEIYGVVTLLYIVSALAINRALSLLESKIRLPGDREPLIHLQEVG